MNGPSESAAPDSHGFIDQADVVILDEIADLLATIDPVPDALVDRIRFAIALEDVDLEMMQLVEETALYAAGRGEERSRVFTFAAPLITLMIRVIGLTDDTVRVDGWLAPPAAHRITVRVGNGRLDRTADDEGRFVVEQMPAGQVQLFVGIAGRRPGIGNVFATPAVVL